MFYTLVVRACNDDDGGLPRIRLVRTLGGTVGVVVAGADKRHWRLLGENLSYGQGVLRVKLGSDCVQLRKGTAVISRSVKKHLHLHRYSDEHLHRLPTRDMLKTILNRHTSNTSDSNSTAARTSATSAAIERRTNTSQRVIVVLDGAWLETAKVGREYKLLNCDDHSQFLKSHGRDPANYRPDICHQCLLTLLDSPLNKAGMLQVYIRTQRNVLIEVNPQCRIPRTYKRFAGIIVQLLHKLKIKATDGSATLMRVIKNPITQYFPTGCRKFSTSVNGTLVNINEFATTLPDKEPAVFVIGAFSHDHVSADYTEQTLSFSQYPLSASVACGKLCNAFENHWRIM